MDEDEAKAICDAVITRTAVMLVEEAGVPFEILADRVLTFVAAHSASQQGAAATAASFRKCADNIDAGCLRSLTEGGLH